MAGAFASVRGDGFVLLVSYVTLLLPTLAFKYYFVEMLTAREVRGISRDAEQLSAWELYFRYIFASDYLEVFAGLAACIVIAQLCGRHRRTLQVVASLGALAAVAGGVVGAVSLLQMGALPSLETLLAGWRWTIANPSILGELLTMSKAAVILAGVAWAFAPLVFPAMAARLGLTERSWLHPASWLVLGGWLCVSAAAGSGHLRPASDNASAILRGFWGNFAGVLRSGADADALPSDVGGWDDLRAAYIRLVYPEAPPPTGRTLIEIPRAVRKPRHIVIVSLETAPLAYYPIANNPEFPTLYAMSRHAIASDHHYTPAPMTTLSMYSILSGTYPKPGAPIGWYGDFESDALPRVLASRNYDTVFIDSSDIGNWLDYTHTLHNLGFGEILYPSNAAGETDADRYARLVEHETSSFALALDRIDRAARSGRHALVCIGTILGHYEWAARPEAAAAPAREKIRGTARTIDELLGTFLRGLAARSLADDVIVVVTGDHGFRADMEFESVGEPSRYGDLTFKVPLLIYAPELIQQPVHLPHASSHVDIAPTVLDLIGLDSTGRYHGESMLNTRLSERITFMLAGAFAGLHPIDAFRWRGYVYTMYEVTDRLVVRPADAPDHTESTASPAMPRALARDVLRRGKAVFRDTAASFVKQPGVER